MKWKIEEPRSFGNKAHFKALKRLDEPNAARYAAALGLGDPFDVGGSRACVRCHATVYKGEANAGVSCESCHGGASGYLDIHQQPGAYKKAVAAGMRDLKEKPQTIAGRCAECHAIKDAELIAAGHPSGDGFNGGDQLAKLVHWDTTYDFGQVTRAFAAVSGQGRPATAAARPTPVTAPPVRPLPVRAAPTTATQKQTTPVAPLSRPTRGVPGDDNWLSQPVRPLPRGYVPPPPRPARIEPPPTRAIQPPPAARTRVTASPPTRKVDPPAVTEVEPDTRETQSPVSPSATARGAALRSEALVLADRLFRGGARLPSLKPPAAPFEYLGPDGELYRIQDEVLVLVLDALRSPPPERGSRK